MAMAKELVSRAAQTVYRDGQTQYLLWDCTEEPMPHPSNFPGGRGLKYPILYDPAWPVHISATKKVKPPVPEKKSIPAQSYALTGMTLSAAERRPIKKTLIFPHRNRDSPFRQPIPRVAKEPAFEPCESLTLEVVEELESKVIYKSILQKISKYDVNDKNARAMAMRKVLQLGPGYVDDVGPPVPRQRKSKHQRLQSKVSFIDQTKEKQLRPMDRESLEVIFVNEELNCNIHGATIYVPKEKNCQIHGDKGILQVENKLQAI